MQKCSLAPLDGKLKVILDLIKKISNLKTSALSPYIKILNLDDPKLQSLIQHCKDDTSIDFKLFSTGQTSFLLKILEDVLTINLEFFISEVTTKIIHSILTYKIYIEDFPILIQIIFILAIRYSNFKKDFSELFLNHFKEEISKFIESSFKFTNILFTNYPHNWTQRSYELMYHLILYIELDNIGLFTVGNSESNANLVNFIFEKIHNLASSTKSTSSHNISKLLKDNYYHHFKELKDIFNPSNKGKGLADFIQDLFNSNHILPINIQLILYYTINESIHVNKTLDTECIEFKDIINQFSVLQEAFLRKVYLFLEIFIFSLNSFINGENLSHWDIQKSAYCNNSYANYLTKINTENSTNINSVCCNINLLTKLLDLVNILLGDPFSWIKSKCIDFSQKIQFIFTRYTITSTFNSYFCICSSSTNSKASKFKKNHKKEIDVLNYMKEKLFNLNIEQAIVPANQMEHIVSKINEDYEIFYIPLQIEYIYNTIDNNSPIISMELVHKVDIIYTNYGINTLIYYLLNPQISILKNINNKYLCASFMMKKFTFDSMLINNLLQSIQQFIFYVTLLSNTNTDLTNCCNELIMSMTRIISQYSVLLQSLKNEKSTKLNKKMESNMDNYDSFIKTFDLKLNLDEEVHSSENTIRDKLILFMANLLINKIQTCNSRINSISTIFQCFSMNETSRSICIILYKFIFIHSLIKYKHCKGTAFHLSFIKDSSMFEFITISSFSSNSFKSSQKLRIVSIKLLVDLFIYRICPFGELIYIIVCNYLKIGLTDTVLECLDAFAHRLYKQLKVHMKDTDTPLYKYIKNHKPNTVIIFYIKSIKDTITSLSNKLKNKKANAESKQIIEYLSKIENILPELNETPTSEVKHISSNVVKTNMSVHSMLSIYYKEILFEYFDTKNKKISFMIAQSLMYHCHKHPELNVNVIFVRALHSIYTTTLKKITEFIKSGIELLNFVIES